MGWNYYPDREVRLYGVSCDLPALPNLSEPITLSAFCDSPKCSPTGKKVFKHISKNASFCPDCKSALYWKEAWSRSAEFVKSKDGPATEGLSEEEAVRLEGSGDLLRQG